MLQKVINYLVCEYVQMGSDAHLVSRGMFHGDAWGLCSEEGVNISQRNYLQGMFYGSFLKGFVREILQGLNFSWG